MKTITIFLDKIISVSEIFCDIISYLKKRGYSSSGGHIIQNGFNESFWTIGEEEIIISFELCSKPRLLMECNDEELISELSNMLLEKHYSYNLKIEDAA